MPTATLSVAPNPPASRPRQPPGPPAGGNSSSIALPLRTLGNGLFNVVDSTLDFGRRAMLVHPGRCMAALLSLSSTGASRLPGTQDSGSATSCPENLDHARSAVHIRFLAQLDSCMASAPDVPAPVGSMLMHCVGDTVFRATGRWHPDKAQHLFRVRDQLPPPTSPKRAPVTIVARAMHMDVELPVTESAAGLRDRIQASVVHTPHAQAMKEHAVSGILRDCDIRGRGDVDLFNPSDVRQVVRNEGCAGRHRNLLVRADLQDSIADEYFLTQTVRNKETAIRAMALVQHQPRTLDAVNHVLDQQIEDEVVARSGI